MTGLLVLVLLGQAVLFTLFCIGYTQLTRKIDLLWGIVLRQREEEIAAKGHFHQRMVELRAELQRDRAVRPLPFTERPQR